MNFVKFCVEWPLPITTRENLLSDCQSTLLFLKFEYSGQRGVIALETFGEVASGSRLIPKTAPSYKTNLGAGVLQNQTHANLGVA